MCRKVVVSTSVPPPYCHCLTYWTRRSTIYEADSGKLKTHVMFMSNEVSLKSGKCLIETTDYVLPERPDKKNS